MTDLPNLKEKVKSFAEIQPWNHNFVLPDGTETRPGKFSSFGKNLNKLKRLEPILNAIDISGKRVLDLGCNEGFFSINLAERGAIVHGVDADHHRIEKAKFIKDEIAKDYEIKYECKNFLKDEDELEHADVILCLGFLHRVPDPITVIQKLAEHQGIIIFEWKAEYSSSSKNPSALFTKQPINNRDSFGTEYWLLSVDALRNILSRYGMMYTYLIPNQGGKREMLVASKHEIRGISVQNERFRLTLGLMRLIKETVKALIAVIKGK